MSSESQEEKQKKLTHTRSLGHKEFLQYIKSQPNLSQTIFNIQKYLTSYQFYFNAILALNKGKDLQQLQLSLKKEYNQLIEGKSFLHKINKSIVSRSKCLDKIKIRLTKAEQILRSFKKVYYKDSVKDHIYAQYVEVQGFSPLQLDENIDKSIETIKGIFIDMARLRDMTIYIIQQIHEWRIKIEEYSDRCGQHKPIYYIFNEKNFYDIIQSDLTSIWQSQLSSYILFKDKRDPLLIRNVVYLQQKQKKQVLEKYIVQLLYPENQEIIDKAIRCLQMIIFNYTPKTINVFEEEQQLIQNYLNLQRKKNPISPEKQLENQIIKWEDAKKVEQNKHKPQGSNDRGYGFGKKLQKRQRIKDIVEKHQQQMMLGPYRPFALTNILEKKISANHQGNNKANIVLQTYKTKHFSSSSKKGRSESLKKISNRPISTNEMYSSVKEQSSSQFMQNQKYQSDPEHTQNKTSSQMFRSLTKLNTIIYEDPNQSSHQTPKMQQSQGELNKNPNFFTSPRLHSQNFMKVNTFVQQQCQVDKSKINIEEEQQPLNVKQFLDFFRADTSQRKPTNSVKKPENQKRSRMRIYSIKQLIEKRKQESKSLPYLKKYRITGSNLPGQRLKKLKYSVVNKKPLNKSRSINSLQQKSFNSYTKINAEEIKEESQNPIQQNSTFISLKSKTIPADMIGIYLRHIISLQPTTSKSFTSYDPVEIQKKLEDPFTHCFIFDLQDEKVGNIGQVIVSQTLGNRRGMLRYTIQFINVKIFQFLIISIARVAEQLLSSTPCQEFLCPLIVDKMDAVSTHFIELIDRGLKQKSKKFCMFHILEKKKFSYKGTDVYERIYVFNGSKTKATEAALGIKMMGNYRSVSFIGKGLLLSSNFKLRSKNLNKLMIPNYNNYSIGSLYIRILQMIMNKYHLKQMKTASMSLNDGDQMVSLVKHNPFIRNLIYGLIMYLRNRQKINEDQTIAVAKFNTMAELLSYLRYRQFDESFEFDFLEQSRFILNHELILAEFSYDVSIQFMVSNSPQFLILGNHRNQQINQVKSLQFETICYLLPTTQSHQKIILMDGKQYDEQITDKIDLFSYVSLFFRNQHSNVLLHDIPEIVIPNMTKKQHKSEKVRCYEGLFRLFPQREFYSGTQLEIINHWQGYYPSAVVRMPHEKAIVLQYPLIIGFYNCKTNEAEICFLMKDKKKVQNI